MRIPTLALLEELERLHTERDEFPAANVVARDGQYSLNPYYKRFGWAWRNIEDAYNEWQETGEIPESATPTDWRALQRQLQTTQ